MVFFFKQKTAYEVRISDWSSDGALPISPHQETRSPDSRALRAVPPRSAAPSRCRSASRHCWRAHRRRSARPRSRIRDRDRGTARFVGSCHPCSGRRWARPAPPRADDRRAGRHGFDIREASAFEMAFLTEMAGPNGHEVGIALRGEHRERVPERPDHQPGDPLLQPPTKRSEEQTSELPSLMRTSYAVHYCKKKIQTN